jgi:hypothetical protein
LEKETCWMSSFTSLFTLLIISVITNVCLYNIYVNKTPSHIYQFWNRNKIRITIFSHYIPFFKNISATKCYYFIYPIILSLNDVSSRTLRVLILLRKNNFQDFVKFDLWYTDSYDLWVTYLRHCYICFNIQRRRYHETEN